MICSAHDVPRRTPVIHMPAPRQSFVADHDAVAKRDFRKFLQLRACERRVVERMSRDITAHKQAFGSQPCCELQFGPCTPEIARSPIGRHGFEISQGLKCNDLYSAARRHAGKLLGGAGTHGKIVLEQLDAVETRACGGFDLGRDVAG